MPLDSYIASNRARAERAYQNTAGATNVNPEYVSTQKNQKPKDYQSGTGVALGAYPIGDGLVQRVSWNSNTSTWEDLGDPLMTAPNGSPGTPSAVESGKILAIDGNYNTKIIDPTDGSKWSTKEDAIQEAIDGKDTSNTSQTNWDGANKNGGGRVVLSEDVLPYDHTAINFDNTVKMEREANQMHAYNIRAYGADPTGGQVASGAIQAAIDGAQSDGRQHLFMPAGTYDIDTPIELTGRSDWLVEGAGKGKTILEKSTSTTKSPKFYGNSVNAIFIIDGSNDPNTGAGEAPKANDTVLRDFRMQGVDSSPSWTVEHGLWVFNVFSFTLNDVNIKQVKSGIWSHDMFASNIRSVSIQDVGRGITIGNTNTTGGGGASTSLTLEQVYVRRFYEWGINLQGMYYMSLQNCGVDSPQQEDLQAYDIRDSVEVTMVGCGQEFGEPGIQAFKFDSVEHAAMIGCHMGQPKGQSSTSRVTTGVLCLEGLGRKTNLRLKNSQFNSASDGNFTQSLRAKDGSTVYEEDVKYLENIDFNNNSRRVGAKHISYGGTTISAHSVHEITKGFKGAQNDMGVEVLPEGNFNVSGIVVQGHISSKDTVTIEFINTTASSINLGAYGYILKTQYTT